jgi:hypothetical protein
MRGRVDGVRCACYTRRTGKRADSWGHACTYGPADLDVRAADGNRHPADGDARATHCKRYHRAESKRDACLAHAG